MRVAITIQHPAHVHFYRPVIEDLRRAGHEVGVFARAKDVAEDLLQAYGLSYTLLAGPAGNGGLDLARTQLRYEVRLLRALREMNPDVVTAIGGLAAAHVAPLVGAGSVIFTDSENVPGNALVAPFADAICTPEWYDGDFGPAHRRYRGLHELAYLRPERFEPDPARLRAAGVDPANSYFVLRFVGWDAHHDRGETGISATARSALISTLDEQGTVYVSTEGPFPPSLEAYRLPVPPADIHHLLHYADLYAGDSGTMATEAALLGTPAVRTGSYAAGRDFSNFAELERYGLVVSTPAETRAVRHARELARWSDASAEWRRRRERLFAETVDVAAYAVDVIEDVANRVHTDDRGVSSGVRRLARGVVGD